jgi:hypothetical protein
MTKKLEEILNWPESKKIIKQEEKKQVAIPEPLLRDINEYDKISAALPQVKGLGDLGDAELDELAQKAKDAYEDIMDLGMNVEARYSARMFEVAASMLGHAITAKSAKLDNDANGMDDSITIQGEGVIISDRNSLLEKLKQMK